MILKNINNIKNINNNFGQFEKCKEFNNLINKRPENLKVNKYKDY